MYCTVTQFISTFIMIKLFYKSCMYVSDIGIWWSSCFTLTFVVYTMVNLQFYYLWLHVPLLLYKNWRYYRSCMITRIRSNDIMLLRQCHVYCKSLSMKIVEWLLLNFNTILYVELYFALSATTTTTNGRLGKYLSFRLMFLLYFCIHFLFTFLLFKFFSHSECLIVFVTW